MDFQFPDAVYEIAKDVAWKHDTAEEDVAAAIKRIRRLKDFKAIVNSLVNFAIQDLVYDARHQQNRRIKNAAGLYGQTARPTGAAICAITDATEDYYRICVGSKFLGDVMHEEIEEMIADETAIREGHQWNINILMAVSRKTKANKSVRECISSRELARIVQAAKPGGRSKGKKVA